MVPPRYDWYYTNSTHFSTTFEEWGHEQLRMGVLPIMAYTGRLHPKGVPFSVFRVVYERVGISLVEVSNINVKSVCKRT